MNKDFWHQYIQRIQKLSDAIMDVEKSIKNESVDIRSIQTSVVSAVEAEFQWQALKSIQQLEQYYKWVEYFALRYGHKAIKEQIGRLFGFRSDKLVGNIVLKKVWPVFEIVFSDMQDLLAVKFARRKETFTQEDRASGFFRIIQFEDQKIPVCVAFGDMNDRYIITHEMTHFRNNVIGMYYYSAGGGINAYEQVVYDDVQEEILAFFSEGMWRAEVQLAIVHDPRYFFYRRLEDSMNQEMHYHFSKDVCDFIAIARKIKELRPDNYLYDLALIPIKKWRRYLKYLQMDIVKK
jgi:hypothetical protein